MTTAAIPTTAPPDRGQLVELPSGLRLYLVDEGDHHSYWRCKDDGGRGRRLTGTSRLAKPYDIDPDNLMRWAARMALEGVCRAYAEASVPGDPLDLARELHALGLTWEQVRDAAKLLGTNVHELILKPLASGREVPDLADIPAEHRGQGQAALRWWHERQPEPICAEQVVYSAEHGYAGRLDLLCRVSGAGLYDGVWLIDYAARGYIPASKHAQVAGYALAAAESGFPVPDALWIVRLRDDGGYDEIEVQASAADFLAGLHVYRSAGRIDRESAKLRAAAEALP